MVGETADELQQEIQKRDEKIESLEEKHKSSERKISKIARDEVWMPRETHFRSFSLTSVTFVLGHHKQASHTSRNMSL
jgi:hypothetical protein